MQVYYIGEHTYNG